MRNSGFVTRIGICDLEDEIRREVMLGTRASPCAIAGIMCALS